MKLAHVRALVAHDLRLNAREIAIEQAGGLALFALAFATRPPTAGSDLSLIANVNFLASLV